MRRTICLCILDTRTNVCKFRNVLTNAHTKTGRFIQFYFINRNDLLRLCLYVSVNGGFSTTIGIQIHHSTITSPWGTCAAFVFLFWADFKGHRNFSFPKSKTFSYLSCSRNHSFCDICDFIVRNSVCSLTQSLCVFGIKSINFNCHWAFLTIISTLIVTISVECISETIAGDLNLLGGFLLFGELSTGNI